MRILIIVLGSGSAMVQFSELDATWFMILAPMAIAMLAALSLVYGLTAKVALHNDLYRRLVDLERDFTKSACEDKQLRRLQIGALKSRWTNLQSTKR